MREQKIFRRTVEVVVLSTDLKTGGVVVWIQGGHSVTKQITALNNENDTLLFALDETAYAEGRLFLNAELLSDGVSGMVVGCVCIPLEKAFKDRDEYGILSLKVNKSSGGNYIGTLMLVINMSSRDKEKVSNTLVNPAYGAIADGYWEPPVISNPGYQLTPVGFTKPFYPQYPPHNQWGQPQPFHSYPIQGPQLHTYSNQGYGPGQLHPYLNQAYRPNQLQNTMLDGAVRHLPTISAACGILSNVGHFVGGFGGASGGQSGEYSGGDFGDGGESGGDFGDGGESGGGDVSGFE